MSDDKCISASWVICAGWSTHLWVEVVTLGNPFAACLMEDQILNLQSLYVLFCMIRHGICSLDHQYIRFASFSLESEQPRVEREPKTKVDDQFLGIPLNKIPLCGYVCISNLGYPCRKPLYLTFARIRTHQAVITFHKFHHWHGGFLHLFHILAYLGTCCTCLGGCFALWSRSMQRINNSFRRTDCIQHIISPSWKQHCSCPISYQIQYLINSHLSF